MTMTRTTTTTTTTTPGHGDQHPTASHAAVAGAVAGLVSRLTIAPLDVLKLRRQLNAREVVSLGGIWRAEGVRGLFRGNSFAMALWTAYGAVQFPAFEAAKTTLSERVPVSLPPSWVSSGSGAFAALVATAATYPLDSYRTRFVWVGARRRPKHIFAEPYRGIASSLAVVIPGMAITFAVHDFIVDRLTTASSGRSGAAGVVAGVVARLALYPADVVKRRLMTERLRTSLGDPPNHPSHHTAGAPPPSGPTSFIRTASHILHVDGPLAFFRGAWPSLLKSGISTGVTFLVYDAVLRLLPTISDNVL